MEFDHIAVVGADLDAASAHVETALGVPLQPGGEHEVFHTHNRLMGLEDGLYLEAIAIIPEAPQPDRARWFDLDRFSGPPRLGNWICRCDDLDMALAALPHGFGEPVALARDDLRWRMAVPRSGVLPFDNCAPALIQWQTKVHPATRLAPCGLRLERLQVNHPEADRLAGMLSPLLDDSRIAFVQGTSGLEATFRSRSGAVRRLT